MCNDLVDLDCRFCLLMVYLYLMIKVVSILHTNKVYIVDLLTNTVSGEIPTATGPEKMMLVDQTLWVLNKGGFGNDSIITVIDINTDEVVKNIDVALTPSGMVEDKNGKIRAYHLA